jgi:hypothetical protein
MSGNTLRLGEHFENLMGTNWELDGDTFGVNLKTKEFCPMQERRNFMCLLAFY